MRPREFVKEYSIKSLVACFSGGKDSLVATHHVLREVHDIEDLDRYVVLVDTTVMIPTVVEFARKVAERFNWPLRILKPEPDFWSLALKWGTPSIWRRWCCYALKLKPIFEFTKGLRPQRAMVTGLRRDESQRRRKMRLRPVCYEKRRGLNAWRYTPLLDWSDKDVLNYMKEHDLPMPPQYSMGIKETCVCGAFTSKKQLRAVRARFPDFYQRFVELQNRYDPGHTVFWIDHKPLNPKELLKQKTLDEFVISQK